MQTWQLLHAITSSLHDNKLTLNVTKSKFMVIGGRNKLSQFNDIALVANNDRERYKIQVSWRDHKPASYLA